MLTCVLPSSKSALPCSAERHALTHSSLKTKIQLRRPQKLIIAGVRVMIIQLVSSLAACTSVSGSGRPIPIRRQVMMPVMTPKFVVKPKAELCSAGTVSLR